MKVVIVGGGASGLLVALWFMRTGTHADTVVIIDDAQHVGEGAAYARLNDNYLLNVRAVGMSAYIDNLAHFVDWLRNAKDYHDAEGFVPRHWYAEYLRYELAIQVQQSDVQLVIHRGVVQHIDRTSHVVTCADGKRYDADAVVMAIGNLAPQNPVRRWTTTPKRMVNWRDFRPDLVESGDTVIIVGTGLTMVDQLIALHGAGHYGQIIAISRHGYLPNPHVARQSYACPVTVDDAALPLSVFMRTMRIAIRHAQDAGVPWQAVIDSVRPHTQEIWRRWDSRTQQRFMRHVRPIWDVHRHRMAPEISLRVNQMITAGQLHVIAGRIEGYEESHHGVQIDVCTQAERQSIRGAIVINCTGPASDYVVDAVPVVQSLALQGAVIRHENGLGLLVNNVGQLVNASGEVEPWLWCIGQMRKGVDWECTAIPDIRVHAHQLVQALRINERGQ